MKPIADMNGQKERARAGVTVWLTSDNLIKLQCLTPNELTNIGLLTKAISMLTAGVSIHKDDPRLIA